MILLVVVMIGKNVQVVTYGGNLTSMECVMLKRRMTRQLIFAALLALVYAHKLSSLQIVQEVRDVTLIGSRIGAPHQSLRVLIMRHVRMETLALSTPVALMASVPLHPVLAVLPSQSFVDLPEAIVELPR